MPDLRALQPAVRTLAMPADTNPSGDIFGGWLLAQMDIAAGTVAFTRAKGRVATVAVDAMAFHQPVLVVCDIATLDTLPERELVGGLAECVKHAVIRDPALFEWMERNADAIMARDHAVLTELVARNVAIKARVVEADEKEEGERAHLNFGHTFGHAIEKVAGFDGSVSHGEAVALGMRCAAWREMPICRAISSWAKRGSGTVRPARTSVTPAAGATTRPM